MKKTLLLMGILLGFLSCQKDTDKACPYLNTSEKHVNDLGVPIQTCGEQKEILYTCNERFYDHGVSSQTILDTDFGKLTIYNDNDYLYIENQFKDYMVTYAGEKMLYVGPENTLLSNNYNLMKEYMYNYNGGIIKIPMSNFYNNQEVAVWMRFYTLGSGWSYAYQANLPGDHIDFNPTTGVFYSQFIFLSGPQTKSYKKEDAYDIKNAYESRYFLYKITKCCNPTE